MTQLQNMLVAFISRFAGGVPSIEREDGQTLAEYAMILALIALVVIGAVILLGGTISSIFSSINNQI
jgi:pilus assembly protein Flp/PilA